LQIGNPTLEDHGGDDEKRQVSGIAEKPKKHEQRIVLRHGPHSPAIQAYSSII
jgi:cobalamin biosynthesis Co2+ chelatase CbiK